MVKQDDLVWIGAAALLAFAGLCYVTSQKAGGSNSMASNPDVPIGEEPKHEGCGCGMK